MSLDLFVPALAGYLVLRLSNGTRFGLLRESGYHVVFRAALVGLLLYAGGWALAVLVPTPEGLTHLLKDVAESGINKQGLDEGSLVLVPLLSGYRSERDRRLVLTTNYTRLLIDDPEMWEHLKLAIPRSDVRWARLFDPSLYAPREGEERPEDVGDNH